MKHQRGVILVGHGAIPKDFPRELLTQLKTLESQRRGTGKAPTPQEVELETRLRQWPRTPETDPYRTGLEALAGELQKRLDGIRVAIAYNEFCAPTVQEAVTDMVFIGVTSITVVPSMLTPGGSHSEIEIPESLSHLGARFPHVTICYAWPFDLAQVASMLASQLARFHNDGHNIG